MADTEARLHADEGRHRPITATTAFLYGILAVFGFIGAAFRFLMGQIPVDSWFPVTTLAINLIGCFIISIVYQYLGRRVHLTAQVVKGMSVGLVGAFTTLSAFYVEEIYFLQAGAYDQAVIYFIVSAVTTFLSSLLGMRVSDMLALGRLRRLQHRRLRQHEQRAYLRARSVAASLERMDAEEKDIERKRGER